MVETLHSLVVRTIHALPHWASTTPAWGGKSSTRGNGDDHVPVVVERERSGASKGLIRQGLDDILGLLPKLWF